MVASVSDLWRSLNILENSLCSLSNSTLPMAQIGTTNRNTDLHEGFLPDYSESRWATIDMKMKQLKKKRETLKPRQYSSTLFSTAQPFNLNFQVFSHPSSKTTLLSTSVDLLKTDIQQQTPTTQATMWKIFRLSNNRLKGLCPWAAVQLDPDNIYVFLFLIFDIKKANKKKQGILADPPLYSRPGVKSCFVPTPLLAEGWQWNLKSERDHVPY